MSDPCPKCGAPRAERACPRCGLVYDKYNPALAHSEHADELRALWDELQDSWDDKGAHASFLERCLAAGQGGYAAARYRQRQDDPQAAAQLERLVARLEQQLAVTATPKRRSRVGLALTVLVVLATLAFGIYWLALLPKIVP